MITISFNCGNNMINSGKEYGLEFAVSTTKTHISFNIYLLLESIER